MSISDHDSRLLEEITRTLAKLSDSILRLEAESRAERAEIMGTIERHKAESVGVHKEFAAKIEALDDNVRRIDRQAEQSGQWRLNQIAESDTKGRDRFYAIVTTLIMFILASVSVGASIMSRSPSPAPQQNAPR